MPVIIIVAAYVTVVGFFVNLYVIQRILRSATA